MTDKDIKRTSENIKEAMFVTMEALQTGDEHYKELSKRLLVRCESECPVEIFGAMLRITEEISSILKS